MRYIGSKFKIIDQIIDSININIDETFMDGFSGTGIVCKRISRKGNRTISNDLMYYSFCLTRGSILKSPPKFEIFKKRNGRIEIFEFLNNLNSERGFIYENYSPYGNRNYFTEENALKIDSMRIMIEQLYQEEIINEDEYYYLIYCLLDACTKVSNTTGTYGAFLKTYDNRSIKKIAIKPLDYSISKKFTAECLDINEALEKHSGDILYLDPPYTKINYSSAYHLLETIACYDSPKLSGITGQRVIKKGKSPFSSTEENALNELEKIIKNCKFKKIVLSYSTQGTISELKMMSMLEKYAKNSEVKKIKFAHREYKNINSTKKQVLYEILYIFQKKELIKSILNYPGNKFKILNDFIIKNSPCNINNFYDVFSGGLTVSININAKLIHANDSNYLIMEIFEKLKDVGSLQFINKCNYYVNQLALDRHDKKSYEKLRNKYNSTPDPYLLFLLSCFGFQNQFRFNLNKEFNNPVGYGSFNDMYRNRIDIFYREMKRKNIKFYKMDFLEFINSQKFEKNDFIYFDPPYLITTASYNDGKRGFEGWTSSHEEKLLEKLSHLLVANNKFMLSNVIEHKGKTNNLLKL